MRPLTGAEQRRVEENIGPIGQVIKDCVHQYSHGVYDYDDLKQIGYMGLCKADLTDKPGRGEFSTYAYIIIRNELYSALEYSARRGAEVATDPAELPYIGPGESLEQQLVEICWAVWSGRRHSPAVSPRRGSRLSGFWPKAIPAGKPANNSVSRPIM